jgi:hypothetical protein
MDETRFRNVEVRFKILSDQHKKGEINSDTLKKELKKMMILDEEKRYWMLGGKTGKWYIYNGKEWNEANPYEQAVSKEEEPESFETRLFSKEEDGGVMGEAAGESGQDVQPDSSTIKIDMMAAEKESDSQDVDIVLTQEDRSEVDLEVVSSHEDDSAAELEVVSTQEKVEASDFEVDLTGADEDAGHEVVLSQEDSESPALEVLSTQDDSGISAIKTVDVSGEEEAAAPGPGILEQAREEIEKVPREAAPAKVAKKMQQLDELVISSIDMISLIFFLGGLGLIVGVLFGATFGVFTGVFGDLINYFPELLRGAQGGIAGGLIFAAIGGIGGFLSFALLAVVISSLYNLIAFIFGGIRVKIK